jgi:hypothetical protein
MRRIGISGPLLAVAAFALSAFAASSASALPKGLCWKVDSGEKSHWKAGCLTLEAGGGYVLATVEKLVTAPYLYCAELDSGEILSGLFLKAKCEEKDTAGSEVGKWTYVLFGLPTLLLLLTGETLPVEMKGENKTDKTKLETKLGELNGEGYLIQLHWTNSSSNLGAADLLFTEVEEKTTKCNTSGDGTGLVLIENAEWHLVYILLDPLQVGLLFLVPQFTIKCGSISEKVKGSSITTVAPLGEGEHETFEGVSACLTNEKPSVTKYWNDEGEEVTSKLEAEINGLGKFEEACENVEGTATLKATEMLEISEP